MLYLYAVISAIVSIITVLLNLNAGLSLMYIVPLTFAGSYLSLIILHFIVFAIAVAFVNINKPADRFSHFYRIMADTILKILVPVFRVKIHTTGTEKIPCNKRFLLVSNHLFDFDPAVFMYCMPKAELAFVGKKDIYQKLKFIAKAMHKLHGLPIDRDNNRNAVVTINAAAEKIKQNKASVGIFPEGYTSRTGELLPFRNGTFKIAKKAHCPIVVATIKNTREIPKNMFRRTTHVYVDILDVIPTDVVNNNSTYELGDTVYKKMLENLND